MKAFEDGKGHGSVKTYIMVAIFLAVVTAIEIAIPSMPNKNPRWVFLGALYFLAVIKFVAVVGFFMHLKYDAKFFTHAFFFGLLIAVFTFLALGALSQKETPRMRQVLRQVGAQAAQARLAEASAVAEEAQADPEAGQKVFVSAGCIACHKVASVPSAVGTVGPALDGLGLRAGNRVPGLDADAYIRQSIEEPNAFVVEAYLKLMPPLRGSMSDADFENIVVFLKGL